MCLQSVQISHLYTSPDGYFSKHQDGVADADFYIWLLLSFFVLTEHASPASFSETSSSTDGFYRYSLEKAGEKASILQQQHQLTDKDCQKVTWPTNVLVTTKFKSSHAVSGRCLS